MIFHDSIEHYREGGEGSGPEEVGRGSLGGKCKQLVEQHKTAEKKKNNNNKTKQHLRQLHLVGPSRVQLKQRSSISASTT